jgi:hypothetical protein
MKDSDAWIISVALRTLAAAGIIRPARHGTLNEG